MRSLTVRNSFVRAFILLLLTATSQAVAQSEVGGTAVQENSQVDAAPSSVSSDFDGLGGNRILLDRVKQLEPETQTWVVQNRMVPRESRFEISPEFSGSFGGDTYTRTQTVALNAHYHINPRWSVGAKYGYSFNKLTPEGEKIISRAEQEYLDDRTKKSPDYPALDYQKSEMFGLISWYPIYGKLNLLDRSVAHFDFYLLAGYGQVALSSGSVPSMTGGMGVGVWVNPKITTRMEMRYQNYKAKYSNEEKSMDLAIASVQVGWLL